MVNKKKKKFYLLIFFFCLNRFVDLLKMIEKDYKDDYIISLLLKEIEEFADVSFFL